jgi:hypothetical protein
MMAILADMSLPFLVQIRPNGGLHEASAGPVETAKRVPIAATFATGDDSNVRAAR